MIAAQKYGIANGQVYGPANGQGNTRLTVIDIETFSQAEDVVVQDQTGQQYCIDAFKLAMVRYTLIA